MGITVCVTGADISSFKRVGRRGTGIFMSDKYNEHLTVIAAIYLTKNNVI